MKPCGQMNNERQRVNEQKQDGQIQTIGRVKAQLYQNPPIALLVENLILKISTLINLANGQIAFAKRAIKKRVTSAGTLGHGLTVGRLEIISTGLPKNFWFPCMINKLENVRYAMQCRIQNVGYMLTTAIKQNKYGVFCATAATLELAL